MSYLVCCRCFKMHNKEDRTPVAADGVVETTCPSCGEKWYRRYATTRSVRVLHLPDGTTSVCTEVKFDKAKNKEANHG